MPKKLKLLVIHFLKFLLEYLGVGVQEREGVFNVIRDPENRQRVLLVRHGYGTRKWSLPGGGIKQAEVANDAATREARDETGLEVKPVRLIAHLSFRFKYGFMLLFESEIVGGKIKEDRDGKEVTECKYFDVKYLPPNMYDAQRGMVGWSEWARMNEYHKLPYYGHPDRPPIQYYSR